MAEIIPVEQKSKLEMNPGGRNNPVAQKSQIEMNPVGRNNPCGTKEQAGDESGWPK